MEERAPCPGILGLQSLEHHAGALTHATREGHLGNLPDPVASTRVLDVQLRRPVAPADVEALRRVATLAERVAGHPVLGEAVWRDLAQPSPETAVVLARDAGVPVGALHVGVSDPPTARRVRLSFAVAPGSPAPEVLHVLADTALADLRRRGGGPVELWVFGADDVWDAAVAPLGLEPARELWQLRVALPLTESPRWPAGITVRPFQPGRDEAAWLTVNNRAFAADPDQGGWDETALRRREHEPWFDPAGFLLAVHPYGIAGFCWTKLHPPAPPVEPASLGEIYVIGVDPDHQGGGLGRALVVDGLACLHDRRGATVGMLFVDRVNDAAVALYRSIGFTLARVDRAYGCAC